MTLTILILTHKRPKLFQRCLESALKNIPSNVEIIVNNDSTDIKEIDHAQVKYFYENPEHLSDKYKFVLDKANSEYVYYLEDDDYLNPHFYDAAFEFIGKHDFIAGNYFPTWNNGWVIRCVTSQLTGINLEGEELQLGQFIMKKSLVDTWQFPKNSHIHNDKLLVKHAYARASNPININRILFFQTTDGKDNISFPESTNYYGI